MRIRSTPAVLLTVALAAAGLATVAGSAWAQTPTVSRTLAADTRFYVDPGSEAAHQAITDLRQHNLAGAADMARLATWPEAQWFTKGTPAEVESQARSLVRRAALQRAVPVLVAYYIPLRDCSQYSAGGAQSDADYRTWVAALARGLGRSKSVVILEPDALANLPSDCGPTSDPTGTISAARIADINDAVDVLEAQPGTSVYLDAGHSQWHSVGDMAARLIQAGVARSQGFFLNVSNFQRTAEIDQYGTWISKCIWFATKGPDWAAGHTDYCASQYYSGAAPNDGQPGNAVVPTDPSTWHWTDLWFDQNVGNPPADQLIHFVADTSRNGQGAWTPPAGTYSGDAQTWCNPPDRGVGDRPTADTRVVLVDAYLFVKTIGESDGQCNRGIPGGTIDPEYGIVDPPAGAWWPDQAHTLARNAAPPLAGQPQPVLRFPCGRSDQPHRYQRLARPYRRVQRRLAAHRDEVGGVVTHDDRAWLVGGGRPDPGGVEVAHRPPVRRRVKESDDPVDQLLRRGPGGVTDQVVVGQSGLVDAVTAEEPDAFALAPLDQPASGVVKCGVALDGVAGATQHAPGGDHRVGDEVNLDRVGEVVPGEPAVDDEPFARRCDVALQLVHVVVDLVVELGVQIEL